MMGPISSQCPVHCVYVGHCTNSDLGDLIKLTAGNPVESVARERRAQGEVGKFNSQAHSRTHTHGDVPSSASDDEDPQLLTLLLHDCPSHGHTVLGGRMQWEHSYSLGR